MKSYFFILLVLFIIACATTADWDSGPKAQQSFEQERKQEQQEKFRDQNPGGHPNF